MSDVRIQIHFDIHQPIELIDMTLAMQALAYEYQSYLTAQAGAKQSDPSGVKLYITKIESNCILAELAGAIPFMGHLAAVMNYTVLFSDFVKSVKSQFDYFIKMGRAGEVGTDAIPYTKRQVDRVSALAELAAKNVDGRLGLGVIDYKESEEGAPLLKISFTSEEASLASKGAMLAKASMEVRENADYKKVLMYFYQANVDDPKASGRTGDKAIITAISSKALKVYIIPETEQQRVRYILDDHNHNPLRTGFIVDVSVSTDPRGNPVAYRVLKIHDAIYSEPDEDLLPPHNV